MFSLSTHALLPQNVHHANSWFSWCRYKLWTWVKCQIVSSTKLWLIIVFMDLSSLDEDSTNSHLDMYLLKNAYINLSSQIEKQCTVKLFLKRFNTTIFSRLNSNTKSLVKLEYTLFFVKVRDWIIMWHVSLNYTSVCWLKLIFYERD
jgi:hypothetical protein